MRSPEEWIGESDDTPVPPRVRLRIFEAAKGRCEGCTRKLGPADSWEVDHAIAICNGGPNSESNLRCLCSWCHDRKTAGDVAEKSKTYKTRAKHLGIPLKRKRRFARSMGDEHNSKPSLYRRGSKPSL